MQAIRLQGKWQTPSRKRLTAMSRQLVMTGGRQLKTACGLASCNCSDECRPARTPDGPCRPAAVLPLGPSRLQAYGSLPHLHIPSAQDLIDCLRAGPVAREEQRGAVSAHKLEGHKVGGARLALVVDRHLEVEVASQRDRG